MVEVSLIWVGTLLGAGKGQVCIASRGKVKKLCLEEVFEHKRG